MLNLVLPGAAGCARLTLAAVGGGHGGGQRLHQGLCGLGQCATAMCSRLGQLEPAGRARMWPNR